MRGDLGWSRRVSTVSAARTHYKSPNVEPAVPLILEKRGLVSMHDIPVIDHFSFATSMPDSGDFLARHLAQIDTGRHINMDGSTSYINIGHSK